MTQQGWTLTEHGIQDYDSDSDCRDDNDIVGGDRRGVRKEKSERTGRHQQQRFSHLVLVIFILFHSCLRCILN